MNARATADGCRLAPIVACGLAAALLAGESQVAADEIIIVGDRDTTLYSESAVTSNGAGQHLFTGSKPNADIRRALVRFDVADAIPAGSVIESALLKLHVSDTVTGFVDVTIYRLDSDWGEGESDPPDDEVDGAPATDNDATWLYRFFDFEFPNGSTPWDTPGGDFENNQPRAQASIGGIGFYEWDSTPLVVSDVQSWLDSPNENFGWILVSSEPGGSTLKQYDSHENEDETVRPMLLVTFTPPLPTGACCLPDGGCVELNEPSCIASAGQYQGDGTSCWPFNPCTVPVGACCYEGEVCVLRRESQCISEGGEYQGDFTTCSPNPCILAPEGACCLPDDSCQIATEDECINDLGGEYQGDETLCDPDLCISVGACCFIVDGSCELLTEEECGILGGVIFQGDDTVCDPNSCPPACPDVNGDGDVNVLDLLQLLSVWGACTGCIEDLSNDGGINVNDLLILLSGWGTCPEG
jgi:hypothetical protein